MEPSFKERVLAIAMSIPHGRVTTYGHIARLAGAHPMASQSITSILSRAHANGHTTIPWHRIVYAGGKVWLDPAHAHERLALYAQEGIELDERMFIKDFADVFWDGSVA